MILWVVEQDRHEAILLHQKKTVIRILDRDAVVLFHNGHYFLHLPRGLSSEHTGPIVHETIIHIRDENRHAVIQASMYEEQYGSFHKIEWKEDLLTLGSAIEDDLYLQDQNLKPHQFVFDRTHHLVLDRYETGTAVLDNQTVQQNEFHNGSCFRVKNVQLILHDAFLMLNRVENLYVHAPAWCGTESILPVQEPPQPIERLYQPKLLTAAYEAVLPEPLPFQSKEHNPLIFMMGPALTMSSASMAAGLISAYNGWLQGREWIDLAPTIILPFVMVLSTLLWNPMQRLYEVQRERRQKKRRLENYRQYLGDLKQEILDYQAHLKEELEERFPPLFLQSGRRYAAEKTSAEFGAVRFGRGSVPFTLTLQEPVRWKADDPIPKELQQLRNEVEIIDLPVIRLFQSFHHIAISCKDSCTDTFWNLFFQFLYRTGPDLAKVVILAEPAFLEQHYWLREVPHTRLNDQLRLIAVTLSQAQELSCALRQNPDYEIYLFVQKTALIAPFEDLDVHILESCNQGCFPADSDLRIAITDTGITLDDGMLANVRPDENPPIDPWDAVRLLNHCLFETANSYFSHSHTLYDLYGITDARGLKIEERWQHALVREGICSCFGFGEDGEPLVLDLSEHGQGPHGLIAGMTGSGKSELIISFLLGLCTQYSPRECNIVMIDFKGGGAAQLFSNQSYTVPHVAGVLSNLDSSGMERALVSFQMECHRREQLFQKMGDAIAQPVMNLSAYQKHWSSRLKLPYLPALVIIVDEFAELKKERPDFMRDLISVARVGRSLGMHMILATQKPSGVVDEQIWSNTRFKICLKVQEKQDSVEMIHAPEASWIRNPGEFYLLWDGMLTHGWSAYANAPAGRSQLHISRLNAMKQVEKEVAMSSGSSSSQAYEVIQELLEAGRNMQKATALWCPPLREVHRSEFHETKMIWLGKADDYYHRTQPPLALTARCSGIFTIDREEKCKLLRTILSGLLTVTKQEEEVFLIDDLSAAHSSWLSWRNLCGIVQSNEEERIRNLLKHLEQPSNSLRTLILTDTPSFYDADEGNRFKLHRLLEQADRLNLRIILFFTTASSCSNRDLTLLSFRLALRNENVQDLSGIFECPVHRTIPNGDTALIRQDHILEAVLLKTSESELALQIASKSQTVDQPKPYLIPCIPDHVLASDYRGEGVPLGMNIDTYEWVVYHPPSKLIILATYEEELYGVQKYLCLQKVPLLRWTEESDSAESIWKEDIGAVLMTLEAFQSLDRKYRKLTILYIGSGFHQQYQFQISYKGKLTAQHGVLFEQGRNQVIRLCESE